MARPTGWDILGLDGDPTPGVVESVQALAKEFGDFAHDVEAAYRSLNSFGSDTTALQWVGQTAEAFKSNYGPLPGRLQKLYTSYSEASDALSAYAPQLQAAQAKADSALRQAQDAHVDLQRATTNANSAAADLKTAQQNHAANPNPQAVTDAQTAHDTAQTNLNNAKAKMAALTAQANQAHDDRVTAAKGCAKAIGHAQSDGIHNKHWWEHVGEALSEWGGKIAEIANDIAPALDVLALATSWIPGVDVVTAGLAEADNLVALAGTGLQIAGDAMQGHWGDALLGAGMLGVGFLGGKALAKFGGKALDGLASKFGKEAEGAEENAVGAEARTAEGARPAGKMADPVDVVSGWMLTDATDLELPGTLPVILRRAYASGYATGHLFGPGWSSTLDQRISVNEAGIHFAGDDAQRLDYPIPAAASEVLPQRGSRWPLVWDRDTDEIRITDPWSGQTRHFGVVHFQNEFGQIRDLTAITDRNGNRIGVLRDEQGTPTLIEHPGYRIAVDTISTATGPRISSLRLLAGDSLGNDVAVKRYAYDERGRLTGVINSSGLPFTYEWDEHDRITAWRDRTGYRYGYTYDHLDRVVRGEGAFMAGSFRYDPANRTTVFTNSLGRTTTFVYDEHGHVTSETDPLGNTTSTVSDPYGRVLSRTDALGNNFTLQRDDAGDVHRVVAADGSIVEFGHNRFHQVVSAVYPDGAEWLRDYDDRGNLISVTDPSGAVVKFAYSGDGALTSVTDQMGAVTRFSNDHAGLSLSVLDPLGGLTRAERDSAGRVARVTNPTGAATEFEWNVEGQPVSRTDSDGARTEWHHDASGRLVQIVDPTGATTVFEPGPVETLLARTGPDGVRHTFAYDSELNLVEVGNPTGATWRYHYDAAGRLASETDFIGRTLGYEYDAAGRLTMRTTRAGQQVSLERDAAGNVVASRTPEGDYRYSYNSAGQLVTAAGPDNSLAFEYDPLGRVVAETVDGRTMRYGYDPAGRLVRRVTASGIESTWTYDAAGRPMGLEAGDDHLTFRFDAAGREVERLFGAGASLVRGYDAAGRLVTQKLGTIPTPQAGSVPVEDMVAGSASELHSAFSRTWVWRADGTPEELQDTLRGTTRRFTSDRAGRVTAVTAQSWTENYAYDAFGNATSLDADTGIKSDEVTTDDASSATSGVAMRTLIRRSGRIRFEHDDAGRLIRTVRRTLDGRRRVWEYSWDSQDRLVQAVTPDNGTWRYIYDPLGRRTEKRRVGDGGAVAEQTVFSWDGPRLAEQQTPAPDGSCMTLTWDYDPGTYRPAAQRHRGRPGGDADQDRVDEAFHAIITDLVGTPTELATPDGHVAWHTTTTLWGRTISTSGEKELDCPLRFPGQYHDSETGLHYNFHRYYDPDAAAYLTPDPLGLAPAPNDHAYTPNPLTIADPLGLEYEGAHYGEGFNTVNPDLPKPYINPKGNWTNDVYTVRQQAMLPHMSGSTVDGKSQFLFNTEPEKITLDAAAYADANGLWVGNKARVYIENGPVGIVGKTGELTNWIRVTREGRMVHSWPVGPPSSGG